MTNDKWNANRDAEEAAATLTTLAETVFLDCKSNGFSRDLAMGYNVLVSAVYYIKTGDTMIGNRCEKFFLERA